MQELWSGLSPEDQSGTRSYAEEKATSDSVYKTGHRAHFSAVLDEVVTKAIWAGDFSHRRIEQVKTHEATSLPRPLPKATEQDPQEDYNLSLDLLFEQLSAEAAEFIPRSERFSEYLTHNPEDKNTEIYNLFEASGHEDGEECQEQL